jgi:hypothetical protein
VPQAREDLKQGSNVGSGGWFLCPTLRTNASQLSALGYLEAQSSEARRRDPVRPCRAPTFNPALWQHVYDGALAGGLKSSQCQLATRPQFLQCISLRAGRQMAGAGWHLFLGLQPDFNQPAYRLWSTRKIILLAAPIVQFFSHVGHTDHNRISGARRPLLWNRAITRWFLGIMMPRNHVL